MSIRKQVFDRTVVLEERFRSFFRFVPGTSGTYTVAQGTTYEAENGQVGGSARLLSDSSFSGGKAVGYLGECSV